MKVLVVEDDTVLRTDLADALTAGGFAVETAGDGETAWFMGDTETFDAVVLDLGLPIRDGLSVLKLWRGSGNRTPVIVLSARGSWIERVEGIDAGADDYLAKPFEMVELVSRLRALTRRAAGQATAVLACGPLVIDTRRMSVAVKGRALDLSPLEYRLLHYLAHHAERIVPPTELAEHVYGDADARDPNALEALIARLRRKTGPKVIETRRGFGYGLAADA
ncbi:MAG: response regulator transcription factor [Caulobacter sp.]